ncbi:hypothetical protein CC78DRAFT_218613 [Lojkania enalia]|uniref:Alb1-domain-containing protein n=1 Tax=Lojkania enalia TaxID=147567 RepID=A0A9P4N3S6_9PLEO|nr:hypothetical protein CC78DRAFT_218613 [Didymosphaeria enalia]
MAKTARLKKRQSGPNSRAARRAVSPSIDLDKSITAGLRASPSKSRPSVNPKPHVLAAQSSGVTKKSKSKPMKRAQRLRQLKAMDKAESALDKLEVKVQQSVGREKVVKERRKGWEEVNAEKKKGKKNPFEELERDENSLEQEREWVNREDMDGAEDAVRLKAVGEVKEVVVPASVPLPIATVEEDELL